MKAHLKSPAEIKISACTIAKNEGKTIARSINSYKKYVDEIVVVDTGSTDDTVEIAKSLGAKIIHFEWCNDFAAAKNAGIDAASGDWLICLDADEYFADDTCKNLRETIIEAMNQNKNAVGCRMENIDINTGINAADGFSVRVFKAGARYRYAVHEEIFNPNGLFVLAVDKSYFYLKHTGYSSALVADKCRRNLDIMLKEVERLNDESRIITYYSYISDSYFGIGKYKQSIEYAKKFIEQSKSKNLRIIGCEIRPYMNIIQSLEAQNAEPEDIAPYAAEFLKKFDDCPDAHYAAGRDYRRRFMFADAITEFKTALELSENYSGVYQDTVIAQKGIVYNYCGLCAEALQNSTEAMNWYFKALEEKNNYQKALFNLLRLVRKMPKKDLDEFVRSLYLEANDERVIGVLSALMCNYMSSQIVECYAAYRSKKEAANPLNADVTAFIMAGNGDYGTAANLFYLNYGSSKNSDILMRCYICADLSHSVDIIEKIRIECSPIQLFMFGYTDKKRLTKSDLNEISKFLLEYRNMGRSEIALKKLDEIADKLNGNQLLRLSRLLLGGMFFEAALSASRRLELTAKSVFIQALCLFNLHRLYEAVDMFLLARSLGVDAELINVFYNRIEVLKENLPSVSEDVLSDLKRKIEFAIESGKIEDAGEYVLEYKRLAEPDVKIFTAEAVVMYYLGEYRLAAIAAECGLLKDEKNCDLLYNAGCVYEKLGNKRRAAEMYKSAIKNCTDLQLKAEIEQMLAAL